MSSEVVWSKGVATCGDWMASPLGGGEWQVGNPIDYAEAIVVAGDEAHIERILRALNGEPEPRVAELEAENEELRRRLAVSDAAREVSGEVLVERLAARDAEVARLTERAKLAEYRLALIAGEVVDDEHPVCVVVSQLLRARPFPVEEAAALAPEPAREQDGGGE